MKAVTSPLREITLQRQSRQAIIGSQAELLTDIYRDDTNIVVWQRRIAEELIQAANHIIDHAGSSDVPTLPFRQSALPPGDNLSGRDNAMVASSFG